MKSERQIPYSLLFKMFFGGKYYLNQILVISIFGLVFISDYLKGQTLMYICLFISLIIGGILLISWAKSYRNLKLLKYGSLTRGIYKNSGITIFNHGFSQIYKHNYTFYGSGDQIQSVSYYGVEDYLDNVKVLYDAQNKSIILEGIVGKPKLDQQGRFTSVPIIDNFLLYVVFIFSMMF